jgi:hypothetical protein
VPRTKGSILLFDIGRQEIVADVQLDGLDGDPDQLLVLDDNRVIGVSREADKDVDGSQADYMAVYGLNLPTGRMLYKRRYPGQAFTGICQYDRTPLVRGPDDCGWLFVDESLCRVHPDGELEIVRREIPYRGKMVWQGKTLYVFNGGRVYNRQFANVVRIPDLFR